MKTTGIVIALLLVSGVCRAQAITAPHINVPNIFFERPDPTSPEWEKIDGVTVTLLSQTVTQPSLDAPSIPSVEVKALHNGKWFAVRLAWPDTTQDLRVETGEMSDACAVQLPTGEATQTSPFMGNKGAPVSILHWKGIWQRDIEKGYQDVKDLHPNTWVDTYRFGIQAATEVKNPLADSGRRFPVEELTAEGFGTLTTQTRQSSTGWGIWEKGTWRVVLARPLKSKDTSDPKLSAGKATAVAFALWDGHKKNIGARKNYAPWMALTLEKKQR